jgi:hypothetical protein
MKKRGRRESCEHQERAEPPSGGGCREEGGVRLNRVCGEYMNRENGERSAADAGKRL